MLKIEDLSCGYSVTKGKNKTVLEHFSMEVEKGEIWCILGCNGVGKTTLFKTILGALPALSGCVRVDGREIAKMTRQELAQSLAYVPQYHTPPFPFSVRDIVLMGRNAYIGPFGSPGEKDQKIVDEVLDCLGIRYLEHEIYTQISGGERQMVLIARAMAQRPKVLMMDEPASSLDYGNQIQMLRRMKELSEQQISIIFTSHHPEHAFLCDANVAAIKGKQDTVLGKAGDIITEELMREMYGIQSKVVCVNTEKERMVKSIVPYLS